MSDSMPIEFHDTLQYWAFNVALECMSDDEPLLLAIGGSILDVRDLGWLLDWMVNTHLPSPPTTMGASTGEAG